MRKKYVYKKMDLTVSCNAACLLTPQSSSRNLRTLLSLISAPRSVAPRSLAFTDRRSQSSAIATSWKDRAMPSSQFDPLSIEEKALTDSDPLISFRLNESTFLASLMPKKEIGADRFLSSYPTYDGRGVVIAIFDSGVDPAAAGLQKTSDGKPKILDILDCTGSGDVDTSKIVKADANGYITGASGERLLVNSSWKNPSQEWHIGCKLVYELFTDTLTSRIKKERKKKWDAINQEAISQAVKNLNEFDKKYPKNEDSKLKRVREDLQNKFDLLKKMDEGYDDRGPVIDVVAWNDGNLWRVAIDTQSFEDSSEQGKLANFVPLTNYRIERKYGIFSKLDACSFVTNVYDDGNIVSLVTDCSPHGTHVAGIASAFHPEESLLNGVAPGAQLISCKIGDTRLGSMETGTGLTRALIAALEHKCDLINMSYGEPTLLPDYGRFVDLVNEAVDKHHLIFISSAGNSGPALSTVGSPGGTSSRIVGIGAYVSPAMAAGAHSVVEPFPEGMEYTWSSRGPTADGDLGVCISAPGAAVAPVPTWTLQRRMLMNGTSMASPSACGGVALLVSAMKAEGIFISPYTVRKALENTATPISDLLVEKLTTGQGLMQVDRAYDYIQRSKDLPSVYYKVLVTPAGKSTPISRGIYLRGGCSSQHSTEWTIKVEPSFHEGENNHEELVSFEERIQLYSTAKSVALAPEYLLLTHNGRTFNIVVDPSMVNHGLHFHEVYGIDCKAPWRGPLFRVPITIIKPVVPAGQPPLISISGLSFFHGHIERRFIDVPVGATWAVATMRTAGFDTSRKFFIDAVQICPLKRPIKWESQVTFSSPSLKSFLIPVKGGLIMELTVAQYWSSGIGSHESTLCDFEIAFHGIKISRESVILDGSEASARIEAKSFLDAEKLVPSATLTKIKTSFRPLNTNISTLTCDRDKLPSGKQILCLTLIYKFKLDEGGEVKPLVPLLNNRIYDTKFESQFYTISDPNNRIYAFGDAYPKYVKIPKGEYTLKINIRHDDVKVLEKLKQLVLFLERKLDKKEHICLSFFSQPDGHCLGNSAFTSLDLVPGESEAFYVGPPSREKLPKSSTTGSVLHGSISYGTVSLERSKNDLRNQQSPVSYQISYIIPPAKVSEANEKESSVCTKRISERLKEEVRDMKLRFLSGLKIATEEERLEWKELCASLKEEYPKYTPLLAKILDGLVAGGAAEDNIAHQKEIVAAANEVIDSVDQDELARFFSVKLDSEDEEAENIKKKMELTRDQLAEALYQKGLVLSEIESLEVIREEQSLAVSGHSNSFEENFKELKKWVDVRSPKYCMLSIVRERRNQRLGTALKLLCDVLIQEDSNPPKRRFYDLKIQLLEEIGWVHLVSYEKQWIHVRFPSSPFVF